MSDYLRWALGQLKSEYGITDMPVDPECDRVVRTQRRDLGRRHSLRERMMSF